MGHLKKKNLKLVTNFKTVIRLYETWKILAGKKIKLD
jgi:hypothetical protein